MLYLAYEHDDPYVNLALEEILLGPMLKQEDAQPMLRVWTNKQPCVVIGRGEVYEQQVHIEAVAREQIPVIRRISGGGTVLHGPRNLNLSFFLPFNYHPQLKNLKDSYLLILSWVKDALLQSHGLDLQTRGSCDLVYNDRKISGTAQARKRFGLLHHMTLLLDVDYDNLNRYLKEPLKQPDYRQQRSHRDFVIGLHELIPEFKLKSFVEVLNQNLALENADMDLKDEEKAVQLANSKYRTTHWNHEGKIP